MSDGDTKYQMTVSLNVLNHMGLNLYSNVPAVLAEVIANSWDADATKVDVNFDLEQKTITVTDNGCGMDRDDVNSKYLYVGYQKRARYTAPDKEFLTPKYQRKPMGRKGIGKLSLFSIANKIHVYTRVEGGFTEAFLMDADEIRNAINVEHPSMVSSYRPRSIPVDGNGPENHGTRIRITDLKKLRLTRASVQGLRRRLARRFSIISNTTDFSVTVDGEPITLADRDYFHKARFIYQYGANYEQYCKSLEDDDNGNTIGAFPRSNVFDTNGGISEDGPYRIKGWIAIAWRSNDLDGGSDANNDNLNKITIVVRGKVAKEDILQEFRLGGMITKYMFGEIEADFLDLDDQPDIATSSRQSISEDDERYEALAQFVKSELKAIWTKTNTLKERAGLRRALSSNPYLEQWYKALRPPNIKKFADKIFGDIDKAGIEESQRQDAYAKGIMMFEYLKMNHAVDLLKEIDITNVDKFLDYLRDVDALEAEHYRQIVEERLVIIDKLRQHVDEDAKERILQEYIFDHLFLLDPGWERATEFEDMERRMEETLKAKQRKLRLDIRYTKYRRVAAAHVIIELKRRSVTVTKPELESQVRGYIQALKDKLLSSSENNKTLPIQAVCIVGNVPQGWDDEETRRMDEESLRLYKIRVMTYDELIDNAYVAYGKFLAASKSKGELRELIEKIRNFDPNAPDSSSFNPQL